MDAALMEKWPLTHGGICLIRPISLDDRDSVLDLFDHLSSKSRYFRYAHAMSTLPEELLIQIIHASSPDNFALVAIVKKENQPESLVGIARYIQDLNATKGEFSLSVSDDYHHEGIGSHLMHAIMHSAKLNGLTEIYGYVVKENHDMLALMRHLDFSLQTDEEDAGLYIATHNCI
ncbi:GNAT family N-acetyltransferase [Polynucleobacter sp. MWH-Creno-3A4]|uniref:GNAT family N-acetyltransferase n=1 Tax=Polynucleobacter sp. MWH-Creno-3A4 TaxID=1855886 RepID=UPI001C0E8365|nr:GNAT family protein [Polynucleobacter sp. MWH-Creno-3A4]MBU3606669.1 GNAT family N-acetyltransferase [Polynucleobacter sp. MWH-Creno-3A4]